MLHRVKTKNGHISHSAESLSFVFSTQSMAGILNNNQVILFSYRHYFVQIGGVAGKIHRQDGFGSG